MDSNSLFEHVLDPNYAPTDNEINQITALSQREIDKLDAEIDHHQTIIQSLAEKRAKYQAVINRHKALLSPIRHLLPELLQQIFQWCLPENRNPTMHHTDPPLLLGRVCSEWRTLAYATVELWSAVHITIPTINNTSLLAAAVRAWLKRAGSLPLSISVSAQYPVGDILPVLYRLMEFSEQWQTVMLDIPKIGLLELFSSISEDLPSLRRLKLRFMARPRPQRIGMAWLESGDRGMNSLQRLLAKTSTLRHLELQLDSNIGWISDLPALPNVEHTCLTSLSLDLEYSFITGYNPSERIVNFLVSFPNLKQCSISSSQAMPPIVPADLGSVIPRQGPARLEKLESLAIRSWNKHFSLPQRTSHISEVFERIVTPSLRRVDFGLQKDMVWSFKDMWDSLMRLLARSSSSLSTLCIRRDHGVLKETLRDCLLASPDLQELVIERTELSFDRVPHNDKIGNIILDTLSEDTICPNLTSLSLFQFSPSHHLDESALLGFVRRRNQIASPLAEFNVLPALQFPIYHSSWNHHFENRGGENREYDSDFLHQIDELNCSSGMRVNLGDVESWACSSSSSWFGFEDN